MKKTPKSPKLIIKPKEKKAKKAYKFPDDNQIAIKALHDAYGCVQVASKKLGISRALLYKKMEEYEELKEAKKEGEELLKDLAENKQAQIIKNIPVKNPTKPQVQILEGFLRTKAKDRGHVPKVEQDNTHKVIEPITFNYISPNSLQIDDIDNNSDDINNE